MKVRSIEAQGLDALQHDVSHEPVAHHNIGSAGNEVSSFQEARRLLSAAFSIASDLKESRLG